MKPGEIHGCLIAALVAFIVFVVLPISLLVVANDDYLPIYEKIQIGMPHEEVIQILGDIRFTDSSGGKDGSIHFREPDIFPDYFFDIFIRDGKVVGKDYDL